MNDKDPIVSALMFSSQMTLDLVWALGWWTALALVPASWRCSCRSTWRRVWAHSP